MFGLIIAATLTCTAPTEHTDGTPLAEEDIIAYAILQKLGNQEDYELIAFLEECSLEIPNVAACYKALAVAESALVEERVEVGELTGEACKEPSGGCHAPIE